MAIDTRTKKLSLINFGSPCRVPLPHPTGDLDQGDKQHLLGGYSGIDFAAPAGGGQPTIGRWSGFLRLANNKRFVNGRY